MVTRIVALSDTYNQHEKVEVPDGDILVHCGDFTNTGRVVDSKGVSSQLV